MSPFVTGLSNPVGRFFGTVRQKMTNLCYNGSTVGGNLLKGAKNMVNDEKTRKPLYDTAEAAETSVASQSATKGKTYNELFCELVEKIQSFTPEEMDEFIRLASQALNRPLE